MDSIPWREKNQAAYRALAAEINQTYAPGRFVAIHQGRIAADAPSFSQLTAAVTGQGKNPRECLVVQAGVDYPETAVIFAPSRDQ
jgi:hypothetical protein